jgi:transcriptional regulator with XRE-family HTH domain
LAEIGKLSVSDRIRQVRKALGLSQSGFGEGIRVSQAYIGNIEQETRKVNDRIIMLVCSRYGVNETWLRQGKGKMFDKKPADMKLERIIRNFKALDELGQDFVLNLVDKVVEYQEKREGKR